MACHLAADAVSGLARERGHGEGYVYAHDTEAGVAAMQYLPDGLERARFYEPGARGFEQRIAERMREHDELRRGR